MAETFAAIQTSSSIISFFDHNYTNYGSFISSVFHKQGRARDENIEAYWFRVCECLWNVIRWWHADFCDFFFLNGSYWRGKRGEVAGMKWKRGQPKLSSFSFPAVCSTCSHFFMYIYSDISIFLVILADLMWSCRTNFTSMMNFLLYLKGHQDCNYWVLNLSLRKHRKGVQGLQWSFDILK